MDQILLVIGGRDVTLGDALLAGGAVFLLLLLATLLAVLRQTAGAAERQRELDDKMAELNRINAELTGRMRAMGEHLGQRQSDLARLMSERLDAVGQRVGQGLEQSAKSTIENLGRLNERLAIIDRAQEKLTGLTAEVVGLKDILANKQARGAFGQGRMEAIIRDGLPPDAYEFQGLLSNRNRPDCIVRLPGDERVLVIDAKFPLEAFAALRDSSDDEARRIAGQRVRQDFGRHVKDIAEKYFIPGETQDIALLFVPSESLYADLNEHFEDVVQRAHKARVIIVSPSLLMLAVQVMLGLVRDARMREQAHVIQAEVTRLMEDVRRLAQRTAKLDAHFRQVQEDVAQVTTSADKALKRGERIEALDLSEAETPARKTGPVFSSAAE